MGCGSPGPGLDCLNLLEQVFRPASLSHTHTRTASVIVNWTRRPTLGSLSDSCYSWLALSGKFRPKRSLDLSLVQSSQSVSSYSHFPLNSQNHFPRGGSACLCAVHLVVLLLIFTYINSLVWSYITKDVLFVKLCFYSCLFQGCSLQSDCSLERDIFLLKTLKPAISFSVCLSFTFKRLFSKL